MAASKLKQGLASVFQSEEQIFDKQKKYGRIIYIVAWAVEIGAALVGLFLAFNLAMIAYAKLPEIEQTTLAQARALGGALPFVIIALIEPTKIYLASGLYHAKPLGWKLLFSFGLLALTFVTFETMYNGLVQQNVNVSRTVQQLQNDRSAKLTSLREKGNELERVRARTPEALSRELEEAKQKQENNRSKQIKAENVSFQDWYDNTYKAERSNILGNKESTNVNDQQKLASLNSRIEQAETNYRQRKQQIIDDFAAKRAEQNGKRQNYIATRDDSGGPFGIGGTSAEAKADAQRQISLADSELQRLAQEERDQLSRSDAAHNRKMDQIDREERQIGKSGGDKEADQQIRDLDQQRRTKEKERDDAIANINGRFEATMRTYQENKAKFDAEGALNADREQDIGAEIKRLIEEDGELKRLYRVQSADLQTVQLTKTACGLFSTWCFGEKAVEDAQASDANNNSFLEGDVENTALIYVGKESEVSQTIDLADLPTDKIDQVSSLWFASIAIIVATLGTFLAFTSFVLQDQKSYNSDNSTTLSDLIRNFGSALKEAGIGIGRFLIDNGKASSEFISKSAVGFGNGIQSILQAIGAMFTVIGRSFRKMTLDIRRYVRAPKVKFETIEKEVVVEKKVEVIVEREVVVEKEVEVIVEKEKVVIKEVPKEIVRKEIVYVPLYSTENGKVLMDADLLTGSAEKTFRSKPGSSSENEET
jgi:hypothetical protein